MLFSRVAPAQARPEFRQRETPVRFFTDNLQGRQPAQQAVERAGFDFQFPGEPLRVGGSFGEQLGDAQLRRRVEQRRRAVTVDERAEPVLSLGCGHRRSKAITGQRSPSG